MNDSAEQNEMVIPKGYLMNAEGHLVPKSKVAEIDLDRDKLVRGIAARAQKLRDPLAEFKRDVQQQIDAFIQHSADTYDATVGGKKGNITLYSYDGQFKVMRAFSEQLVFDERIQVAKSLIDECILDWSKGSNANIKALVQHAFQVDSQGNISRDRVLGLKRLDITDEKWLKAMQAINDSIQVASRKSYVRIYERDAEGNYQPVSLDLASV
ncbi:MAG TPA: DUF3164 family protein [Gammaproteobacteria bacterium]